jgi:hypothetical protein
VPLFRKIPTHTYKLLDRAEKTSVSFNTI